MRTFITFIFLHLSIVGFCQEYSFSRLTEKSGLPINNTYCFLKDAQGFLWFGTSSGLCRYDGYEIKQFTQEQGYEISSDHVNVLIQDAGGTIWIGTETGGLNSFDPKSETFETFSHDPSNVESIAGDRIQSIVEGEKNTLWIGFDNGLGLSKFNKETKKSVNYNPFNGLKQEGVKAIRDLVYDNKNNTLWLGTTHGLIEFDLVTEKFRLINHPLTSINRHGLFALERIDENRLIAGFFHAGVDIYNIDKGNWDEVYADPSKRVRIFNLSRKSESEFWVAARRNGLAVFDLNTKKLRFINSNMDNQNTPFPGLTYEVFGDNEDVWVGSKHGISYSTKRLIPFELVKLDFADEDFGMALAISGKYDKIYVIGLDNHLWELDKLTHKKKAYPISTQPKSFFFSMLELTDRIYLIGNNSKVLLFDKKTKSVKSLSNNVIPTQISLSAIKPWTKDKAIILSRYGGSYSLNLQTNKIEAISTSKIPDDWQHDAVSQANESIWIGTNSNLLIYDPKNDSTRFYNPEAISSKRENHILSIAKDKEETLWLGTSHGLLKIDDGKETLYNVLNSDLQANQISDIEFDQSNSMWVKTRKGVSRINLSNMEMIHFGKSDGLDPEGTLNSVDGEILYGTFGGYYNLSQPNKFQNESVPKVHITDFQVAGEKKKLKSAIDFVEEIHLSYQENSFSFSFTSPTFSNTEKIKYAYRLTGLDKEWSMSQSRRYANYTNLDGGNYEFEIKAGTRDGTWSNIRKVRIYLDTPFWETWWFYTLCVIIVLSAGFSIYRVRFRVIQRKAELEAQELRIDALKNRFTELHSSPSQLAVQIKFDELNNKLNNPLTEREFEVLKLSLEGKTNPEISDLLFISVSTVKFHLRNTYSKMGVGNRKEAFQYMLKTS